MEERVMKYNSFEFEGKEYEIKSHIPMKEKYILANLVVDNCLEQDETTKLYYVDEILRKALEGLYLVKFYTGLELPEGNILEVYDNLRDIIDRIEYCVGEDSAVIYDQIKSLIDFKVNKCQSLEFIVKEKFDQLIAMIPNVSDYENMLTKGIDAFNGLDKNKLKIVADSIGKKDAISKAKKEVKAKKEDTSKLN